MWFPINARVKASLFQIHYQLEVVRYRLEGPCTKDSSINIVLAVDNHLSPTLLADPRDTTWQYLLSREREYHNNYNYGLIMLNTNNVKSLFLTVIVVI